MFGEVRIVARLKPRCGDYTEEGNTALAGLSAGERNTVKLFEAAVGGLHPDVGRAECGPLTMPGRSCRKGLGWRLGRSRPHRDGYHVIQAQKATVTGIGLGDGSMNAYEATLVGAEPEKERAAEGAGSQKCVEAITVGSSSELLVGQSVFAIGNPLG